MCFEVGGKEENEGEVLRKEWKKIAALIFIRSSWNKGHKSILEKYENSWVPQTTTIEPGRHLIPMIQIQPGAIDVKQKTWTRVLG